MSTTSTEREVAAMFEQAVVTKRGGFAYTGAFLTSCLLQTLSLGAALMAPLIVVAPLPPFQGFDRSALLQPPPPAVVHLVNVEAAAGLQRNGATPRLYVPPAMPTRVASLPDLSIPVPTIGFAFPSRYSLPDVGSSPYAGEGVTGGTGTARPSSALPPVRPPEPAREPERPHPPERIRVGGDVQAARLVHQVLPVYPPLAVRARVEGTVRLEGIIGTDGRIQSLRVLSGHPLLIQAGYDAVSAWRYSPTLLNSDPVEVLAPIEVHFRLR